MENIETNIFSWKLLILNPSKVFLMEVALVFIWIIFLMPKMMGGATSFDDFIFQVMLFIVPITIVWGGIVSFINLTKGSKKIGVLNFLSSCILLAVFIVSILLLLDFLKVFKI